MKNSKGTPSKDTGAKNNNSDYDVDFQNSSKAKNNANNNCKTATSNKSSQKGTK